MSRLFMLVLLVCFSLSAKTDEGPIRIASKMFSESYVLAEIVTQLLIAEGFDAQHEQGLGGTLFAYEALRNGEIDIYPEYSGTLTQAVLKQPGLNEQQLQQALAAEGLVLKPLFGFNNSYAIAVPEQLAVSRQLKLVSDLQNHPDLHFGFSHEFLNRGDGWPTLSRAYGLTQEIVGIEHALAYRALKSGQLDATDAYTTDGELDIYNLRLLEDDLDFFPGYLAGLLTRGDQPAAVMSVLGLLENRIDEATMRGLNHRVVSEGVSPAQVAAEFLQEMGVEMVALPDHDETLARVVHNTLVHLKLTSIALLLGCLVAVPLALLFARRRRLASGLLYVTGLLQTIPALALLALLIPVAGLGAVPAVIALFLYSLLPIVRNTLTGLFGVDPVLKEVAASMGLTAMQQLWKVELPLAMPTILAGIKTAAIICIGTATLAAFVGAGGLGEPIITGLSLNDHGLILEGAIPAALLALTVELIFELVERFAVPAHLRVG